MSAKLHFRYSSMNAGKSTQLLQIAYNYAEGGHAILLFTAGIDDRQGVGVIGSRLGIERPADVFFKETDFYQIIGDESRKAPGVGASCVLIDEAQFLLPQQVVQIHKAVHHFNIPVMCFGLRSDFLGVPFPGAAYLLSLAEDIQEIKALCACLSKSTMNIRLDDQGNRVREGASILIGGNSRYKQVCGRCFY